jgi:hypothetical protein
MYEIFKNSLAKVDKVSFEELFCIKIWLLRWECFYKLSFSKYGYINMMIVKRINVNY